ncbi:MAG: type II secretion system secretin GspD [Bryobacter sp.]|nr:type II secretion system secretin GspD [Bryobacter sp.]
MRLQIAFLIALTLRAQQPTPAAPQTPAPQAPAPAAPPATAAQTAAPAPAPAAGNLVLNLPGASLVEVIDTLARVLKINYILDPRVKGNVTIQTYGEIKSANVRDLLDMILRINGFAMVEVGDIFRIVPTTDVQKLPMDISTKSDAKEIPQDERMILNLVFLKYASAAEMKTLITPFLGEGAQVSSYEAANLLLLLDNGRNMRRNMELINMFDSDTLAKQRIKIFELTYGRPSDVSKDLQTVFKGLSLASRSASVQFMPIDRLNMLIALAPNPGVFEEVESWIKRLDIPVKAPVGGLDNYVYRVKYGRADAIALAVTLLYSSQQENPYAMMTTLQTMMLMISMTSMLSNLGNNNSNGGAGGVGAGGIGAAGLGGIGALGAGGIGGLGGLGFGGLGALGGLGGLGFGGLGAYGANPYGGGFFPGQAGIPGQAQPNNGAFSQQPGGAGRDASGNFVGQMGGGLGNIPRVPKIVPNPFDNSLIIQCTAQEYEQIERLLNRLDVPPRQVLIEAKIYEVSLTGAYSSGVQAFLQRRGASTNPAARQLLGQTTGAGATLTAGLLVGQSRELLAILNVAEEERRAKVVSAPSIIATDSIAANINIGTSVPVLTSQALTSAQSAGSSLFTNTVSQREAGVSLNIVARVLPSGIVTLEIDQEISSPQPPSASAAIQSPSFSQRNVRTQVTVQDGDTIAIGGIITESDTFSTSGVPGLHKIPVLGAAFGSRSKSRERTELVVFMTPRVIYDTPEIVEASEELRSRFRRLNKIVKD